MPKISKLTHFKNLIFIFISILFANFLISRIIDPNLIFPDFGFLNSRSFRIIFYIFCQFWSYFVIFQLARNFYFVRNFDKIYINNLVARYFGIIISSFAALILTGLLIPNIFVSVILMIGLYLGSLNLFWYFNAYDLSIFTSLLIYSLINFGLIWLIWKYFDYQIKNETKLTEK